MKWTWLERQDLIHEKIKHPPSGSEKGADILQIIYRLRGHGLLPRGPRVVAKKCTFVGFIVLSGSLLHSWKM